MNELIVTFVTNKENPDKPGEFYPVTHVYRCDTEMTEKDVESMLLKNQGPKGIVLIEHLVPGPFIFD